MPADYEIVLEHAKKPYDPVKAHEYYMRTRKLHPRKKGVSYTVQRGNGRTVKLSAKELTEEKLYAQHRVTVIKGRLETLQSELQKKMAETKKKPTAADKTKQKQESKKYRNAHKTEIANKEKQAAAKASPATSSSKSGSSKTSTTTAGKTTTKKSNTTESLTTQIVNTRNELHAAVQKQRELASATRNG